MDKWVGGWMDEWTSGWMAVWVHGWVSEWTWYTGFIWSTVLALWWGWRAVFVVDLAKDTGHLCLQFTADYWWQLWLISLGEAWSPSRRANAVPLRSFDCPWHGVREFSTMKKLSQLMQKLNMESPSTTPGTHKPPSPGQPQGSSMLLSSNASLLPWPFSLCCQMPWGPNCLLRQLWVEWWEFLGWRTVPLLTFSGIAFYIIIIVLFWCQRGTTTV